MNNQDQSFLDDIERADPAYKFGKEYLAGLGIDIETGNPMMARQPNYDPAVMERLGLAVKGKTAQADQYSEPAGPPSIYNEHGQPGAQLGWYRQAANFVARGAGKLAYGMAATTGLVSKGGLDKAYEAGEGATRGVLTQAVPGILEMPEKTIRWGEDMGGLARMGMVEVMRSMAEMAAKKGDAQGAQEFYDQARELENDAPDNIHVVSDAMQNALAKVVNTPQSEGEQAWRDVFSLITSMVATKNIGPTAGPNATRAAKLIENAIRGGITDFVITDPRRSSSVEGVLEMISPQLADKARNFVSTGGAEEENDLKLHLARRFSEVGFGAVAGTLLDSVMGGFKGMRLSRLADDWRGTKAKLESGPLTPELENEVTKIIDDLESLTNPEVAGKVNAGAAAEAEAAGLPPVGAGDAGLKVEGADAGPLPDAALGRLQQLPGAHKWLTGRPEHDVRMVIQTLDSALGEVNDITTVGTRASRKAGKEQAEAAGAKYRAEGEAQAQMDQAADATFDTLEGTIPVNKEAGQAFGDLNAQGRQLAGDALTAEKQAVEASVNKTADELFDTIDGTLSRNQEAGEMFGTVGKAGADKVEYDQRLATNRAAKSVFDTVSGTTTLSDVADNLFNSIDLNKIDFDTKDFDILLDDLADGIDTRPVSKSAAKEGALAKGATPEATALRVVADKGASIDTGAAAEQIADLHGVDPEEARRMVDLAKVAVSDATTKTYAKVADATMQVPEKTVVDVALAMQPFPQSVVKEPMYQGTGAVFKEHSDDALVDTVGGNIKGHYFTRSTQLASEYAMGAKRMDDAAQPNVRKVFLDIQNPVDFNQPPTEEMLTHLQEQGFAHIIEPDQTMGEVYDSLIRELETMGVKMDQAVTQVTELFKSGKFDAIGTTANVAGVQEPVWIVFSARQIKNALGGGEAAAAAPKQVGVSGTVKEVTGKLESGDLGIEDAVEQVLLAGKRQKMGREKAVKMLQKALKLHNSPIVQAIANHPAVVEVAGAGALALAMLWGMDHIKFDDGDSEVSQIGKVL